MNLNDFGKNAIDPYNAEKRRRYERRIAEAKELIAATEQKIAALNTPQRLAENLPRNTELFLPLGDLRIATDGNLYVHPFSTLNNPEGRRVQDVILVRVRSNNTLHVTASRDARLPAAVGLASAHKLGWNKVTKFSTE